MHSARRCDRRYTPLRASHYRWQISFAKLAVLTPPDGSTHAQACSSTAACEVPKYCTRLQHATHRCIMRHIAASCDTSLQHATLRCNMRHIAAACDTSLQHATHHCNMRHITAACDTSLQHATHRCSMWRTSSISSKQIGHGSSTSRRSTAALVLRPVSCSAQRHCSTVPCTARHTVALQLHCTALHCAQGMRNAAQRRCGLFTAALLRRPLRAALRSHCGRTAAVRR